MMPLEGAKVFQFYQLVHMCTGVVQTLLCTDFRHEVDMFSFFPVSNPSQELNQSNTWVMFGSILRIEIKELCVSAPLHASTV